MKKLLATSAIAVVAMAGAASAQSVLERVLTEISGATSGTIAEVNGTFANIAENIGGGSVAYVLSDGSVLTQAEFDAYDFAAQDAATLVDVIGVDGIDGSITNVVDGLTAETQEAIASASVSATEWVMPTLSFGDMATTALGAVNTGDITLGVNSTVEEAQTSSTQAVSSVMEQLGGSEGTGVIVLNVASNMTGVNGSISNTMGEVNGTIGSLSTTALGAVNTGTITSGVNAAVQGIVGTAGQ
jgi:hypothetical protein